MIKQGVLFVCVLTLTFISCKSKKVQTTETFKERTADQLAEAIENHNVDYDWFTAKAKIHFKSSYESGRVTATVRIKKDSLIWMNFKKFGLSMARMQITTDSIYVMYPFDNYYERGTIDKYSKQYGIDLEFKKIQSFLVGNCLIPDEANIKSRRIGEEYELYSSSDGYTVKYMLDPGSLKVNEHSIIDSYGREVLIDFSDYKKAGKHKNYSHKRTYYAPIDANENASADISISDVEFNVPKSTPFNIPSHYITYDN